MLHTSFVIVNLQYTEEQLKKRWATEYKWGRKQADIWDSQTNFIYNIHSFDEVNQKIFSEFSTHSKFADLRDYALNRWYNFQSAMAIEYIFSSHPLVRKVKNSRDKEKDFYINGLPFDHKTSVFPKGFDNEIDYAIAHPKDLARWFYINQSGQQRFHLKNRLFVVLCKSDGQHWRLKAELSWIKLLVDTYLDSFDESNLLELSYSQCVIKTDVIFGVR
ncbi:hypothetical protein OAD66_03335 [Bacteroidia bacterium]|nr:hypothetical protein [Bacteroidia bacterium]